MIPSSSPRPSSPYDAPSSPQAPQGRPPVIARSLPELRRALVTLLPELRGRALRLAGDRALADDLVQDTVERALRFEEQYLSGTNLRAWLYQILFSVFITRYRRTRREKNALKVLGSDPCAWVIPEAFEGAKGAGSLTPSTSKELEALPTGFRRVLVLVDLEERSYREAAEELGVPVGTVMSRLHRGRKMLAGRLAQAA